MNQWSLRMRILTFCVAVVLAIAYFLLTPPSVDNNAVISSATTLLPAAPIWLTLVAV